MATEWTDILGCEDEDVLALEQAGVKKVKDGDTLTRLPSGGLVFYQDSTHRYYAILADCRASLTSVTSVLKVLDKPALVHAAWRLGLENLDYKVEWGKAATRGTSVHDALEALAVDGVAGIPDLDAYPEEDRGYVSGVAAAWIALAPRVAATEVVVADVVEGVAGRFDLLAEVDGQLTLMDLKTNARGRVYSSHFLQLAGYEALMEASGWARPERSLVLAVGEDGSWQVQETPDSARRAWPHVLAAFKANRELERDWKAATA